MSISPALRPINLRNPRTIGGQIPGTFVLGVVLCLAAAATLGIWSANPFVEWTCEGGMLILASWVVAQRKLHFGPILATASLLVVWGFAQLAAGLTVYRYATLNASLRVAGMGAVALVASVFCQHAEVRDRLLRRFTWFGFVLGVVSVVAYHTSAGTILWLFPSPYPDVWGPFLSRNNFAQFLELVLPVALWLACIRRGTIYLWMSATMLACGLVSASRAGAALLIAETAAVFVLARPVPRRLILLFALSVISFAALAGGEVLLGRLRDNDPFLGRREIFASSMDMIGQRPWTGFGLGTFATVYPGFARYDPGAMVEHAHNDWLEWATEGGWPYMLAWMLLAIATARPALRSIWGIGVPAVFLHALVDYPFARLGVAAWVFILAGALESTRRLE